MKLNKTLTALAVSASFGLSGQAFAIGTAADLDITNEVVLEFSVGSVTQTPQTNAATFKVDNKIDFTLEWNDTTPNTTVPSANGAAISYALYNAGNSTQSYQLTSDHIGSDGTTVDTFTTEYKTGATPAEPFPATPGYTYTYYQESGAASGFQASGANADTLLNSGITEDISPASTTADLTDPAKATIIYLVVNNILDDAIDTDILGFNLNAQALTPSTATPANVAEVDSGATPDNTALVQAVFADNGNDGQENADSVLEIVTAKLEITKSVKVINDPINGLLSAGNNPKAIPGATVEYTITVTNTGRAAASLVTVTEDLNKADANNENLSALDEDTIANLDVAGSTTATSEADFKASKVLEVDYTSIPAGTVAAPVTRTISFEVDIK